jgi:signal transduction histidine kinase
LSIRLLVYLTIWGVSGNVLWEYYFSQLKWSALIFPPSVVAVCMLGWIFFWSFPADRARHELLARVPLIKTFALVGSGLIACYLGLYVLAQRLDERWAWDLYTLVISWISLPLLAVGSVVIKSLPLVRILRRKGAEPRLRQQARVLLVGIWLGLGAFTYFVWMPFSLHFSPPGDPPWNWSFPLTIIYPLSIAYAVLRYQLFDIRVVIRKGLIYSLLTTTLTGLFLALSLLSGYLFQWLTGRESLTVALIPALMVAFLFQPVRGRIQTIVDRAFFRHQVEFRHAMAAFGQELSTLRTRPEVIHLVLTTVRNAMGVDDVRIYLPQGDSASLTPAGNGSGSPLPLDGALVAWLSGARRPLVAVPDSDQPEIQELGDADLHLAIPLLISDSLQGVLALGEKRSGEPYNPEDLETLSMLAHSAALALDNARLHEQRMAIMRQQLARVTAAQEDERQRIARELHDGVGPTLASMNLRLRTARKLLERDQEAAARELDELATLSQENVRDIRRMIYDLRPAALDKLGLVPALRDYLNRCSREHTIEIRFSADNGDRLAGPAETTLFRIVQEAVNNVVRHANARGVEVSLAQVDGQLALTVSDDGQGFDPAAPRSGRHVGLWSMRERIEQLGGRFELSSRPGAGTVLCAWLPL